MLPSVQIWRSRPVLTDSAPTAAASAVVFPTARQALAAVIAHLNLGRRSYIGIPDYSSHCVVDSVSRRAMPVPLRFLPPTDAAAVLVYDQWGWQRPSSALAEVLAHYPPAGVIWDRVDSLPDGFEMTARTSGRERVWQLFSLSKTLGAGGGGLLWRERDGWVRPTFSGQDAFGASLETWAAETPLAREEERAQIDLFLRREIAAWPPKLHGWLSTQDIDAACASEARERRARLALMLELLRPELPSWMRRGVDDLNPAPGVLPVRMSSGDAALLGMIRDASGLDLCFYHFDFSDSYLEPDWVRVLPIPLHSEASLNALERLSDVLKQRHAIAR